MRSGHTGEPRGVLPVHPVDVDPKYEDRGRPLREARHRHQRQLSEPEGRAEHAQKHVRDDRLVNRRDPLGDRAVVAEGP